MSGDLFATTPDPREAPGIRWGVLAPGGIAHKFAEDVSRGTASRIAAVGSRSVDRARAFAETFAHAGGEPGAGGTPGQRRTPRAHGSYADLVADEGVDAIYIASPHSHHRDHALLALAAGKPVLIEKSFARSDAEAREVFDAAREQGLFAMEALWTRFLPVSVALRSVVASGVLGEILRVRADHSQSLEHVARLMRPELAGGALLDLNVYNMSLVHDVLGPAPLPDGLVVRGRRTATGVDESEVLVLDGYADHPRALAVVTSTLAGVGPTDAEIIGTRARVDISAPHYQDSATCTVTAADGTLLARYPARGAGGDGSAEPAPEERGHGEPGGGGEPGGFAYEAAEVARCLADGRLESDVMPWRATLHLLEVADAARAHLGVRYP